MIDSGSRSRFEIVSGTIDKEMCKPYCFGRSDCFFLALGVIDALQNSNLQKQYSGIYQTFFGAQKVMKKRGFKSMSNLFSKHLDEIAPAMATLGDVVVVELEGREHSAICVGGTFLTRMKTGESLHSLADVKSAFRVV